MMKNTVVKFGMVMPVINVHVDKLEYLRTSRNIFLPRMWHGASNHEPSYGHYYHQFQPRIGLGKRLKIRKS